MIKPKIIRLIIYLVISIGLIVLLLNIPREKSEKEQVNSDSKSKDIISPAINVEVPQLDSSLSESEAFKIVIDSVGQYYTSVNNVSWNELQNEIRVQKKVRPKLYLKISVHSKSKSEILMKLMEFAQEEKIKIGITKN